MDDLQYIQKGGWNDHFKYAFVQEADVKAAVSKALRAHGLFLSSVEYTPLGECTGKAATLRCEVTITDGQNTETWVRYQGVGAGTDSSDKAPMKACAASLKYALTSGFLIATGDDPEEDGGTAKKGKNKPAETTQTNEPDLALVKKLMEAIADAKSPAELNKFKPQIAAYRGSDPYDKLANAFVMQGKALTAAAGTVAA